ncbi:MAG: hypothetical protein VKL39_20300 [Leptolyngbyaceae bacterium]|nr:hypothetical protein [Leptolyngbyaceae bacterium]
MKLLIPPILAVVSTAALAFPAFALREQHSEALTNRLADRTMQGALSGVESSASDSSLSLSVSDLHQKSGQGERTTLHARLEEEPAK